MGFQNRSIVTKNVRISPKKATLVLREIRGKTYPDALLLLKFLPYRACQPLKKSLRSAAAEAAARLSLDAKDLYVKAAFANHGSARKKFRPKSRGRADQIRVSTSHIVISLASS